LVEKGAKKLKKSGLVKKVSTRKGYVCIVSLDGKEKLVENVNVATVLENSYVDAEEDID
jgi:hypothetical protein